MSSLKRKFIIPALILPPALAAVVALFSATPEWWVAPATRTVDPAGEHTPDGVANLGQLKHFATMAAAHLDEQIAGGGGAGPEVASLLAAFGPLAGASAAEAESAREANYAPANLGQVKAVVKVFYDRLLEVGYDTRQNLIDRGYPATWPHDYPWDPSAPIEDNYAPAQLGQLKMVFSFDLAGFDIDQDGLPDAWEETAVSAGAAPSLREFAPGLDSDLDGYTNREEFTHETDPADAASNPGGEPVIYVDASFVGQGDGSLASPYQTIQNAIGHLEAGALPPAARVVVLPGTYSGPGNRSLSFGGRSIKLLAAAGASATHVDLGGAGRFLSFENGETVEAVLEGFTVTDGLVTGEGGGAVYIASANPVIRGCTFVNCESRPDGNLDGGEGGAIYIEGHGPTLVEGNPIVGVRPLLLRSG